ncbi:MAG: oligoendopeptidase F [Bacillota bacterium]|nr:oligoendopeptidase F [Bacillota bacterium]
MKEKDRKKIKKRYQWNIESMYPNAQACRADMEKVRELAASYGTYSGKLGNDAKTLAEALKARDEIWQKAENVYVYARLKRDEDNRIPEFQALCDQSQTMLAGIAEATSFFAPEFARISKGTIRRFLEEEPSLQIYGHLIDELLRGRSHVLSTKEEKLLAGLSELSGATNDAFTMLNNADIRFGSIRGEDGRPVEVTHGTYVRLMQNRDRRIRQKAYRRMYQAYEKQKNTLATLYNYNTKQDVIFARIRKHPSAIEAALFGDNVPLSVYDNLIEEVHRALPGMHRYMELKKKTLSVPKLRMYDLYVPLVPRPEKYISYEEAQKMVKRALRPLGEEYAGVLERAFEERWADVFESEGKTSGAYSFGSYDSLPFMLLNYDGRLEDVFTLIHETGHSIHAYFTRNTQPYVYGSHSIFTAEVASTVNEALLMRQLLGEAGSKEEKAYLLNLYLEEFRTTLFRQTMFAEFERATHGAVEAGEVLTAGWLSETYAALNRMYHGSAMEQDDLISMEWSRIPHFYHAFYVYKYATGYSAATALSASILEKGDEAAGSYVDFLRTGESNYPIELLKTAGVDMSGPNPVRNALATFRWLLDQLEELL